MITNVELIDKLRIAVYAGGGGGIEECVPAGPDPWPSELGAKEVYFAGSHSCGAGDINMETIVVSIDSNKVTENHPMNIDTYFYPRVDIANDWTQRRTAEPDVVIASDFVRSVVLSGPIDLGTMHPLFGGTVTKRCTDSEISSIGASQRCSCEATNCGAPICSPKARSMVKESRTVEIRPIPEGTSIAVSLLMVKASWGIGYNGEDHDPTVVQSAFNTNRVYAAGPTCPGSASGQTFAFPTNINVRIRVKKYYNMQGKLVAQNYISTNMNCGPNGTIVGFPMIVVPKIVGSPPSPPTNENPPVAV